MPIKSLDITDYMNTNTLNTSDCASWVTTTATTLNSPTKITLELPNTITLCADTTVSLHCTDDLTEQDKAIKAELAYKIAKQLLQEDLIHVESDDNISTLTRTIRARVKVIQE